MRIRIVTFGLNIPAETYTAHAVHVAPAFTQWPGLLGKWWLDDTSAGSFGGVYLFASRHAADRSRETDLFRGMLDRPRAEGRHRPGIRRPRGADRDHRTAAPYGSGARGGTVSRGSTSARASPPTSCGRPSATCRNRSPWSPASARPGGPSG